MTDGGCLGNCLNILPYLKSLEVVLYKCFVQEDEFEAEKQSIILKRQELNKELAKLKDEVSQQLSHFKY